MRYLSESSLLFQRSLLKRFLSGWTVLLTFRRIGLHVNSFPSTFRITRSSGFLYHRFNWELAWPLPQSVLMRGGVSVSPSPSASVHTCWRFRGGCAHHFASCVNALRGRL